MLGSHTRSVPATKNEVAGQQNGQSKSGYIAEHSASNAAALFALISRRYIDVVVSVVRVARHEALPNK